MRRYPPTIPPDTPSDGEKLVFELLAADSAGGGGAGAAGPPGPDAPDWAVLHSLDVAHHRRQMEGEIDSVGVVPRRSVLSQSAVCSPFRDSTLTSKEWHGWQVIDRRDLDARPTADHRGGAGWIVHARAAPL